MLKLLGEAETTANLYCISSEIIVNSFRLFVIDLMSSLIFPVGLANIKSSFILKLKAFIKNKEFVFKKFSPN